MPSAIIVFLVLIVIIAISGLFSKAIVSLDNKNNINPSDENKILNEDEDAVAATIVAAMDFYNETKKHARIMRVTRSRGDE
jgi:Na+-transporting methylmalonyl-CoA/oxaloacetate decarboxylase gamma subunit